MKITVPDVARAMGVPLSRTLLWSVGGRIAAMYERAMGEAPPKGLRPKTTGAGSHCFALYPLSWRGRIESEVRRQVPGTMRQVSP
jgi:hypothetical protein